MEESKEGKDESAIKPVSALRSRFENLQRDRGTPPASPIGGRSPFLPALPGPATYTKPTPTAGGATDQVSSASNQDVPPAPLPRPRRPSLPTSRPLSMVSVTSPPVVTVDSPSSPGKRSLDIRRPLQPTRTGESGRDSPTKPFAWTPARTPSPALEARMTTLLQAGIASKPASEAGRSGPPTPEIKPKPQSTSVPPPVNRAAKPQIPVKPAVLSKKPEALNLPEPSTALADNSVSPFGTPPSSAATSPRKGSDASRVRNDSDASFAERTRGDSDASFVERIRTDSTSSSLQRVREDSDTSVAARERATSNASFVESSSLPDSWHHFQAPPMHHQAAARRDQQANGVSRPARYRPIGAQDTAAVGDPSDDRPRLPVRPELQNRPGRASPPKVRSGRTSPVKQIVTQRPLEGLKRSQTDSQPAPPRIPAAKPAQRSALMQGFDRTAPPPTASNDRIAPAVPAPRRSMDKRRELPPEPSKEPPRMNGESYDDREEVQPQLDSPISQSAALTDYPDASQANRRKPEYKSRPWSIPTDYDTRLFAVCGECVCTTGQRTKAWNLRTGEQLMDLEHLEIVRVSSIVFKPSTNPEDEGNRVWLGTGNGEIHEIDIPTGTAVKARTNAHSRKEIIRMYRYASELWTLDDNELNVWRPDHKGMPSLDSQFDTFRTKVGHTFSIAVGKHLWYATGKDIRVYAPSARSDTEFYVLQNPLSQPHTVDVTSGATLSSQPDLVYFGHQDGKVSIYNRHKFSCAGVVSVSMYRISSLTGVGEYLWAGFSTGMIYVYDTSTTPWRVKKDWPAHDKQICGINADRLALQKLGRLQVVTLGAENVVKVWDGFLEEDWIESRMQAHDSKYCTFSELTASVLTWNAGASKPSYLQSSDKDSTFLQKYLTAHEPADIFVFGFQELVDLEDKKVTAKSFFKSKKKDTNDQEHMSHQYRAWRDYLERALEEHIPLSTPYVLLHTSSLVGLFTCVFVKSSLRNRIRNVQGAEVKRGMGGRYGNKGALILRMILDDSSLCFINCHLAAGQSSTAHRHEDVAAILQTPALPPNPLSSDSVALHSDVFTSGGDGSLILDHEICILNGDLNYRIDTMGRDTVINHILQKNYARLLERDQLLISRKKNAGFRLRAFQESEIKFAPTYKYDVRSDEYDTSEKRRSPAWCDRILYRGLGKVKMEEYDRWEVRVSDHRPVSGWLRLRVKSVDRDAREKVWGLCRDEFEVVRKRVAKSVQLEYLTLILGMSQKEALAALK